MPTTYAAAVSLADSMFIAPSNPHGWVLGFYENPAKFLQDRVQPYADAGIRLMLHNAFGRGGKTRTFSRRYDGQPASVTAAEWCYGLNSKQDFALSNFVKSPGMEGTFFYIGAPELGTFDTLLHAAGRMRDFAYAFPTCIPVYDNTGDIKADELCAGSALFAAHLAMESLPFVSPVPWGIEPNPALENNLAPHGLYGATYVYGTPLTWEAKSRRPLYQLAEYGYTPIVAIRGDDYKTPDERHAVAREWGPKVAPYNGIVVVHGVSVAEMEGLTR